MFDLERFIATYVTKRETSMFLPDIEENRAVLKARISGKSVLVIGGAGSIGSSFVKQILPFEPGALVVVDINENALAELTRDLRSTPGMYVPEDYIPYPMDFASPVFRKMFIRRGGFDIVANFSAHKHVRSEKDVFSVEALLQNNVLHARKLLDLLSEYPPEAYFCVSTDKAANPVSIMNCTVGNGTKDSENPIINSGGAIFLRENTRATLASTVIDGHSTTTENGRSVTYGSQYANAAYGGGIYAVSGSTVSMTNGGVIGSTASADGAGIYLEEGARLNLSGGLNFGGTDLVGGSGGSRDDLKGTDGNFVLKDSSFKTGSDEPLNGAKDYPKDADGNYKVRQDIYIKGYIDKTGSNPTPATSLNVAGALTDPADTSKPAPEGSIWVWAEVPAEAYENNHYEQFKQFATFSSSLSEAVMENSVKAFRDSVDDERSQNGTDSYLTGTLDGDLTGKYIYWYGNNGYKKVILRKADRADFESLKNAEFDIYRGNGQSPYVVKDRVDKSITDELRDEVSKGSGVIWIGTLPYGVYYLHEKTVPSGYVGSGTSEGRWFYMVVGDDPTTMSRGYESRDAAKTAYENEKKTQGNP